MLMAADLEDLHSALSDLVKLYQFRSRDERLYYGVTVGQAYCMRALWLGDELAMTDLARSVTVSLSTMTGIVDQLVELGLATRSVDQLDRRSYRVRLTRRGRSLYERSNREFIERLGVVAEKFSARELETVRAFLLELASMVASWRSIGERPFLAARIDA